MQLNLVSIRVTTTGGRIRTTAPAAGETFELPICLAFLKNFERLVRHNGSGLARRHHARRHGDMATGRHLGGSRQVAKVAMSPR